MRLGFEVVSALFFSGLLCKGGIFPTCGWAKVGAGV